MAKKLLAVVLAVLIAVSAMAVTVFADYEIPLYKNKNAWQNNQTAKTTQQITFIIPVYGTFGWLTAGDYMVLNLPSASDLGCDKVNWSIEVDGMSFKLGAAPEDKIVGVKPADKFIQARVTLGYLWHDYDGTDTAIPQTIVSTGASTNIRLVGDVTFNHANWNANVDDNKFLMHWGNTPADYATKMRAQWFHSVDGVSAPVAVESSVSYVPTWNYQKNSASSVYDTVKVDFVTNEWTKGNKGSDDVPFTWDHTLAARQKLIQAAANNSTIQFVVELDKEIVGQATYNLFANAGSFDGLNASNQIGLWWQYENSRTWVDAVSVDGTSNKLVFNVPANVAYNSLYGTFNSQFVIFENITLMNSMIMKDYLHIDRSKVGDNGVGVKGSIGSFGRISWDDWNGEGRAKYDGKDINYARSGVTGKGVPVVETLGAADMPKGNSFEQGANHVTSVKVDANVTYTIDIAVKNGGVLPYELYLNFADPVKVDDKYVLRQSGEKYDWGSDKPTQHKIGLSGDKTTVTVSGADLVKLTDVKEGDLIAVWANSWGDADWGDYTVTISRTTMTGSDLGSDVMATKVYLNIVEPEADTTPDPIDTPTEGTDNPEELEGDGDNVNVEDNAPAKEDNPKTGVAFAVVPMLVAAVAAVLAKKH